MKKRPAQIEIPTMAKETRSAVFSDDRVYRYTLDIVWNPALPLCQFIGLNPSTADEVLDDPTVRRCKDFARQFGCGGLVMTNIFAYRETDPFEMMKHPAPIGEWDCIRVCPKCKVSSDGFDCFLCEGTTLVDGRREKNDDQLVMTAARCKVHIAAWGVHGEFMDRGRTVANLFVRYGTLFNPIALKCLGTTKDGHPKHPLYLARTCKPVPFSYPA